MAESKLFSCKNFFTIPPKEFKIFQYGDEKFRLEESGQNDTYLSREEVKNKLLFSKASTPDDKQKIYAFLGDGLHHQLGFGILEVKHFYNVNRTDQPDARIIAYHYFGHDVFVMTTTKANQIKLIHHFCDDNYKPLYENQQSKGVSYEDFKKFMSKNTFPYRDEVATNQKVNTWYNHIFKTKKYEIPEPFTNY